MLNGVLAFFRLAKVAMDRPQTRRLICLLLLCGVAVGCDNHAIVDDRKSVSIGGRVCEAIDGGFTR